jgi:hypothetical protein
MAPLPSPEALPPSLEALIQRRLARLSAPERRLVELGAVIGHPLSKRLLQQLTQLAPEELAAQLDQLVSSHLFEKRDADQYRFVHDKLRECAYARLDAETRRTLHLRAGLAIEAAQGSSAPLATEVQILAHHFARGGQIEKALHYLQAAAEVAHHSFASREVIALSREALELTAGVGDAGADRRWRWHFLVGSACFGLGRLSESHEHLCQMLRLLRLRTPARGLRGAWRVLAEVACQLRHRWFGSGPARWADRSWMLAAATAYDVLMQVCFFDDDAAGTLCSALASMNLAERAGPSSELVLASANVQATVAMLGLERLSSRYAAIGLAASSAARDLDKLSSSLVRSCSQHIVAGDWAELERGCEQIGQNARTMHYERKEEEGLVLLAYTRFVQGKFDESRKLYERLHSSAASRGDTQSLCWSFTGLAYAELIQGASSAAIDNARAGLALAGSLPGRSEAINLHSVLAVALLRTGNHALAEHHASTALELGRGVSLVNFLDVLPWACLAEVFHLLALQFPGRNARRGAAEATRRLQRCARFIRIARPRAYLWSALGHWELGRWERGRSERGRWRWGVAALEKGLRQARALAMPYDEAYLELVLGLRLGAAFDQQQEVLRHASARFAALGAGYDALATRTALGGSAASGSADSPAPALGSLQLSGLYVATAFQAK